MTNENHSLAAASVMFGKLLDPKPAQRSPREIAEEIYADWTKVNYAAEPYLDAMLSLETINQPYGLDSGKSIVLYFLANAGSWRGEKARAIKAELKAMVK